MESEIKHSTESIEGSKVHDKAESDRANSTTIHQTTDCATHAFLIVVSSEFDAIPKVVYGDSSRGGILKLKNM